MTSLFTAPTEGRTPDPTLVHRRADATVTLSGPDGAPLAGQDVVVQQAMNALRNGRTSFVIAHRLSTIRDADVILVMEHGDIVEQGSHDELLAAGGAYARLYASQFAAPVVEEPAAT